MAEHQMIKRVRVYRDASGEFRWTAYAWNNETIAVSSEGYVNEADCQHVVATLFPDATLDLES